MLPSITSIKNVLKNKELSNIVLFSTASLISLLGTSVYNFAISLYVLKLTGSSLSFAITLTMSILSTILINPFAGVLADRLNKKLLALITDLLNGVLLIILYLLTIDFTLNLPLIYVSTFLLNVFSTIYGISIEAAKPNLVSTKRLISINSINKVIESICSISGPMMGGIIFAFLDIRLFILINSFSFIISAILELFIDFDFNSDDTGAKEKKINFFTDIIEGITYLKTRKDILSLLRIFIALNFFIGLSITVPMPYIINNVLKLNAKSFGIIQAAFPVGMIFGGFIIKGMMEKYPYQKIIKSMSILLSFCMIAVGFSVILHYTIYSETILLIYFILIMILSGVALSCIDIPIFYILQQTIPDDFRGRVLSIGMSMAKIILPVSLILAGTLISLIPTYILPMVSGIGLCIFSMRYIKLDMTKF